MKYITKVQDWYKLIKEEMEKTPQKQVVLIGGASSSGKSFSAKQLASLFNSDNISTALISADEYYKGIAKIIISKALAIQQFEENITKNLDKIEDYVRECIKYDSYTDKFKPANKQKIDLYLSGLGVSNASSFISAMELEYGKINFDEPFSINFERLASDIKSLLNGNDITIPKYEFTTGELNNNNKISISGKSSKVIIIEGLYALRNELTSKLDQNKIIKTGVFCNTKTLLARKFRRDIKGERSNWTPESTIISYLTNVMPAYYTYIYPSLKTSEFLLNATITPEELVSREYSEQEKYATTEQVYNILNSHNIYPFQVEIQKDYFLEDKTNNTNDISICLREIGGLANSITIKSRKISSGKFNRMEDCYPLEDIMSVEKREINGFLEKLKNAGFVIKNLVKKTRHYYSLPTDGSDQTEMLFRVDDVDDVGTFVEFPNLNERNIIEIVKGMLNLKNPINKSYYELSLENLSSLTHEESELKFETSPIPIGQIRRLGPAKKINQHYFDITDSKFVQKVESMFDNRISLSSFSEARIRIINSTEARLTLKSNSLNNRKEFEKEIPLSSAKDLIDNFDVKTIKKTRYTLAENSDFLIELDIYNDRKLSIIEAEYNSGVHTAESVKQAVASIMGPGVTLTDVTLDPSYKNSSLAKI